MRYDELAADSTRSLDSFRKKFNFLYLCRSCARSFDSMEPLPRCKFCYAEGPEILDMKSQRTMYRYYCAKCEKNHISESIAETCIKCGSRFIHVYLWKKKSRHEFARTRARKLLNGFKDRTFRRRTSPAVPPKAATGARM